VRQEVDPEANIIVGATYDPTLGEKLRVSIVASGMSRVGEAERAPPAPPENWVRGAKAAASQAETARQAPPPPPKYAPEPQRDYRGGAQDLQQRLTEALQYPAQPASNYAAPRQPAQPAYDQGRGRAGDPWRGANNVTIEDGPPQLQGATPPPLPPGYASNHDHGGAFAPQPPSEVRRQQQRRTPDAGDHHQATPPQPPRGYRPPDEAYDMPSHQAPIPRQAPQPEPRRRLGLFERIAGRVRGAGDSDTRQQEHYGSYEKDSHDEQPRHGENEHYDHYAHPQESQGRDKQDVELPVFFRERRR
jgi:cell division protein FtsZ